jgi:aminoglycoside phosphotransferase (APT) family kinase protein
LDELHEEIRVVLEWFPRFREAIEEPLVVVESLSDSTPPLPPVFSHGDFRYTQLIFLKKQAGLVDFGSICQAEPALDLGEFLAYQRMTMRKEYNAHPDQTAEGTDELCELFLTTYIKSTEDITEDEDHLRARVSFYEILNLLRLTVHSLQKLKGARAQAAMQVLQERIVCLLSVK